MSLFTKGDKVQWNAGRGYATGTVEYLMEKPEMVGDREVHPSLKDPTYAIMTQKGKKTYHHSSKLNYVSESMDVTPSQEIKANLYKKDDKVQFQVAGKMVTGTIIDKLKDGQTFNGNKIHTSELDPQYEIITDANKKHIHHHASALSSVVAEGVAA